MEFRGNQLFFVEQTNLTKESQLLADIVTKHGPRKWGWISTCFNEKMTQKAKANRIPEHRTPSQCCMYSFQIFFLFAYFSCFLFPSVSFP